MADWSRIGRCLGTVAGGVLLGHYGIKILSGKDAKTAYTHCTAAVLRMKDEVMKDVENIRENAEDIGAELKDGRQKELSKDDPLVVPPAYGARHAMATSLDKYEWLEKVNMDVHYRAAAGVGRKFVQENQEQLMDRAWKQVEAVQALNRELYQRLLSIGVNTSLHGKVVGPYGKDNKYLASLMFYLGSMKDASSRDGSGKDTSITAALAGKDVAAAFATPTFHRMTDQVAKIVKGLDTKTLMENMLEHHTCAFPDPYCYGAVSIKALKQYSSDALVSIFNTIVKVYATNYFKLAYLPGPSSIETTFSVGFNAEVRYGDRKTQYIGAGLDRGSHEDAWDNIWLFWNDWKWMDDFKKWEQLSKKIDWSKKQIPHSPILWYYLYPGSCKRFFDEGCADHPSYGYSVIGHEDGKAPDLIGYPSERYVELFGEKKPITKFRFYGKYLYIVNEDAVRMIVASQSGGNTSSIEKGESAAVYYYDLPYVGTVKGLYRPILYRYTTSNYGTQDWRHYLGDYTEIKNESFSCEQDEEVSRSYRDRLSKYLSRPSFIEINPNKFQEEIQTFNSEDEYQQFLLGRTDKLTISYITLWKQFNAQVSLLEMYTPQQAGTPAAPAPQPAPTLSDDLPYEEACSIVGDFFSEFFADSATGYKLRSNYIDELLRSKYPILAYPIFPEPTYYYLKKFSEELVIPGAGSLPEDSVTLFESNPAFIEAFLAGMNTEMGREMLWREYPTDQRGSYFRKFWDSESTVESIRKETFFDITTLHTWEKPLGENMLDSKANLLIFALKGRLMRLYPKTRIYLHRAVCTSGKKLAFDPSTDKEGCILQPVMETFINGDTLLVGFNISFQKALGNPGKKEYGYMLTFKEDVEGLDFAVEKEGSDFKEDMDSAVFADTLKNDPSIMGKHISLFLNK